MPPQSEPIRTPPGKHAVGPSMLDLVRLSREAVFPPGGEALYRKIGLLTDLESGMEVLDAACGRGISSLFLARTFGVSGVGVDPDPVLIEQAIERTRVADASVPFTFETSPLDDLPFRDGIFDVSIGEVGLAATADPARAVAELVRVTRPLGSVVLVQLTWTGHVAADRREMLVSHLGARPLILVEWKQLLRDAGVVELTVEDWSDAPSPFRPAASADFGDLKEMFTPREQVSIMLRAWQRWGWRGVRGALMREREVRRLLTRERALGLTLIKGTRWHPADAR